MSNQQPNSKTALKIQQNIARSMLESSLTGNPDEVDDSSKTFLEFITKDLNVTQKNELLASKLIRLTIFTSNFNQLNWLLGEYQGDKTKMLAETLAAMNFSTIVAQDFPQEPEFVETVVDKITDPKVDKEILLHLKYAIYKGDETGVKAYFYKRDLQQELPLIHRDSIAKLHL